MNTPARIKSQAAHSPNALRVIQTSKGVFWSLEDTVTGERRLIISTKASSTRRLAKWILKNVQVPEV